MSVKISSEDVVSVTIEEKRAKLKRGEKTEITKFVDWLYNNKIRPVYVSQVGGGVFIGYIAMKDKQAVEAYLDRLRLQE